MTRQWRIGIIIATVVFLWYSGCGLNSQINTYSISGTILTGEDAPLAEVTLTFSGSFSDLLTTTDADGNWMQRELFGEILVTPNKDGYIFSPRQQQVSGPTSTVHFTATATDPFHDVHGLYVQEGTLMRKGEPYQAVGVNSFNLFRRTLLNPSDTSYRDALETLAEFEIPFVRFSAMGYWPIENQLYFNDKEAYFQLFDDVVQAAEEFGIGLIPSFFWHDANVPDLMGEPVSAWGDPTSATHEFMRTYVEEVVTRYINSPALWGWEFGNEYNLHADVGYRAPTWPNLGTPAERTEADELSMDMLYVAFEEFALEVRKHDPHRIVLNGNSAPRKYAWHRYYENSSRRDSEEQLGHMLIKDNPDPIDVISVHMYPFEDLSGADQPRFYELRWGFIRRDRTISALEFLEVLMSIAASVNKPLFLGEFGASEATGHERASADFFEQLEAIEEAGVPLSAMWVFDHSNQEGTWNVTATNSRAYQLEAVQQANQRLGVSFP